MLLQGTHPTENLTAGNPEKWRFGRWKPEKSSLSGSMLCFWGVYAWGSTKTRDCCRFYQICLKIPFANPFGCCQRRQMQSSPSHSNHGVVVVPKRWCCHEEETINNDNADCSHDDNDNYGFCWRFSSVNNGICLRNTSFREHSVRHQRFAGYLSTVCKV